MGQAYLMRHGEETKESTGGLRVTQLSSFQERPTFPEDNTIAVITDGVLSHAYIQNSAPDMEYDGVAFLSTGRAEREVTLEGSVDIKIGISGAHVKKGGAWEPADTYLYDNEAWHFLWSGQLYEPYHSGGIVDDEYTDYTGGFAGKALKAASNSSADAGEPEITRREYSITADALDCGGIFYTAGTIDLTPYKTLVFEGTFERNGTSNRNFTAAVWSKIGAYYTSNMLAYVQMPAATGTRIELDISDVNEKAHLGLGLTFSRAEITRCYLVPKDV